MRLLFALVMLVGSIASTPIFAQTDCCQCGLSACGPAPKGGDCSGCDLVAEATCDGDTGQCMPALEGSLPSHTAAAPALGGSPIILLAAGLTALALSLLARRRQQS